MALKLRATGGSSLPMVADLDELIRSVKLFADADHLFELRSLTSGAHRQFKGDDVDSIARAAGELPSGIGIYFIVNPIGTCTGSAAKDRDISSRRWLYIDVDPVKPEDQKDNPATEQEKRRTGEVCDRVNQYLQSFGWPCPIITDSGNGFGMFFRCDMPNDSIARATYKSLLGSLAERFNGPDGTIDKSIHNAARLAKLPGTWARKGSSSDERPHRPCRLVFVPEVIDVLSFETLRAATLDEKAEPAAGSASHEYAPSSSSGSTDDKRTSAYVRKAIDSECARIILAGSTGDGRNNALNRAAFSLGQLVASGVADRDEVETRLYRAACDSGLDRDTGGERAVWATIKSGMTAGMSSPRGVPEKKADPIPKMSKGTTAESEEPLTVSLSRISPAKVDWLIKDRIPRRFITVFAGRTAVGKSFVSLDLIARLSRGDEIPMGRGECFNPSGTLILSEDSHEYVLAPRLIEAGADLKRIHAMTWKAMGKYSLGDTSMLTRACREVPGGVSLVMIDPPTNFLEGTDEHKNSEVRQLVMKVVEWAFATDAAVLFILHVNKLAGKGVEALNRVMGSVAWVTTSRIAHSFCPRADEPGQCLWVPLKNNLGEMPKALAYRVVKQSSGQGKVEWIEEVDMSAEEAMGHSEPKTRRDVVASKWLVERFREKLSWESDDLMKAAKACGISRNAIFEAKELLKLPKARKETHENGSTVWVWAVPSDWEGFRVEEPTI